MSSSILTASIYLLVAKVAISAGAGKESGALEGQGIGLGVAGGAAKSFLCFSKIHIEPFEQIGM